MLDSRECNFAMGTILGKGFPQALVHTVHSTCAHGEIRHLIFSCLPVLNFAKFFFFRYFKYVYSNNAYEIVVHHGTP